VYNPAISHLARDDRGPAPHRCSYVWETSPIPRGKYWPKFFGGGNVKKQQGKWGKCERENGRKGKDKEKIEVKILKYTQPKNATRCVRSK
jgi:hypothetical protein